MEPEILENSVSENSFHNGDTPSIMSMSAAQNTSTSGVAASGRCWWCC